MDMIGQTVSHYRILEKLGEGGMGVVYKAQDTKLDRLVAMKFLPGHLTADQAENARFLQEAKAASALNHPNVCTIYDIKEENNQQFIVMEFVDGTTMKQKLPIQKLQDALTYALQIGDALQEAHSKGIVHRDIKCENIMVNSKNQIKVMDFGLAKLKGSLKLTKTSSTVGTLAYMAPEQIQGGDVDARSDIFSFGVVLFEMLTGHMPFRGDHEASMMYSILQEEPESVQKQPSGYSNRNGSYHSSCIGKRSRGPLPICCRYGKRVAQSPKTIDEDFPTNAWRAIYPSIAWNDSRNATRLIPLHREPRIQGSHKSEPGNTSGWGQFLLSLLRASLDS